MNSASGGDLHESFVGVVAGSLINPKWNSDL